MAVDPLPKPDATDKDDITSLLSDAINSPDTYTDYSSNDIPPAALRRILAQLAKATGLIHA